uniref:Uncharacterized protein n=1 Tax=Plectus sambesii TaxID=2011161 RepID=A0A914UH43_9BILA
MPCRLFLPPSPVFLVAFLLVTTSLPSIDGRVVVGEEETREHDGKREKRELVAAAVVGVASVIAGLIGTSVQDLLSDPNGIQPPSGGGCLWIGRAPLCNAGCPAEYELIRKHNGRCHDRWFADTCLPDPSFGEPCTTVLGPAFKKRLCCKRDAADCTWGGLWKDTNNAIMDCRYNSTKSPCGHLSCSVNHKKHIASIIGGDNCNQLAMRGHLGRAICGYIAWDDGSRWYKTTRVGK